MYSSLFVIYKYTLSCPSAENFKTVFCPSAEIFKTVSCPSAGNFNLFSVPQMETSNYNYKFGKNIEIDYFKEVVQ